MNMKEYHHHNHPQALLIDGHSLSLKDLAQVARAGRQVSISPKAIQAMQQSRQVVEGILAGDQPVYGINTGFGSLCDVPVSAQQASTLQNNLIISHAVGCGPALPQDVVRAMLLLRANALCQGFSGIRPQVVQALVDMLNAGVHPVIPEKGSLGASGDLAPLSHMALVLLGKGEANYQGQVLPGQEAMDRAGIQVQVLQAKEGLALINGTQAMCALGSLTLLDAYDLARQADLAAAMSLEALLGRLDAFDPRVHALRPQPGQALVANNISSLCQHSPQLKAALGHRVQDAYSLRCVPQVHGAVRDSLAHVQKVLETELNAVTDNPLIFPDSGDVISGGNFHGEPLALVLDFLGIAASELASISERRLERLVNPQLSGGLPAFLAPDSGVNSGFMIIQYTAAAMVSDNKSLAHPASVDSIPSSANQEDHVSMGMNAARKASRIIDNCFSVLALELYAAAQALDLREGQPAPIIQKAKDRIRKDVAFVAVDRELRLDVAAMNRLVRGGDLLDILREVADFA